MSKETNRKFEISLRIPFIVLADILLITLSFFITYSFMPKLGEGVISAYDIFLSALIYNGIVILVLMLFGAYKKKTLEKATDNVLIVFSSMICSHMLCWGIFEICPFVKLSLGFGFVVIGSLSAVLITVCHILQNTLRIFYLKKISQGNGGGIPTLIIGAGFTGKMVCHELMQTDELELVPVCFLDDDEEKISTKVCGLDVYGPVMLLPELCKKHKIGMIVFAIPSCSPEQRKRILAICSSTNCDVRIIPSLSELKHEQAFFKQSHTINVEKLLGRDAIRIENNQISKFLRDKVCLVTGGGGSIGSELCRQIVLMQPKKVVILDIYENNAYEIQQELVTQGFGDIISVEIASVRDLDKLRLIFEEYKFDIIFHAAAHKHVPLMETNPEEAIKNNVRGTYNIAHLAHKHNVKNMVLISTDKAVNPTNVMGASKRVCEMIMQYMSQTYTNTKFTAVRFGNVLGSNGSVIPLFTKQIEVGGPVTVTHPDIIRYFMTIPEAVSLVLEAATMSDGGEIFVLDMGEPVKIVTLAENLIKMYGYQPYTDMKIEFCGLRQGEKLYEELLLSTENLKETYNKKIFIMDLQHIDGDKFKGDMCEILSLADSNDSVKTVEQLHRIVPEFKTPAEVNGI